MEHVYSIKGMHCESCVDKITRALRGIPGVLTAQVSLHPPQAGVTMERHVTSAQLQAAVQRAGGYSLHDVDSSSTPTNVSENHATEPGEKESLYPLLLILAYLTGTVLLIGGFRGTLSAQWFMSSFMAGFFLIFSFFKLLNLRGFADAYRSYDVLARSIPAWGFAYPFVELALGVAFLTGWNPLLTNIATLVLMSVGAIGVFKALLSKSAIRCVCLGTVLNLPMTKVTLVEDLGMAAMAAVMLLVAH